MDQISPEPNIGVLISLTGRQADFALPWPESRHLSITLHGFFLTSPSKLLKKSPRACLEFGFVAEMVMEFDVEGAD